MKEVITNLVDIIGKDESKSYLLGGFTKTSISKDTAGRYVLDIPHYRPDNWHLPTADALVIALIEVLGKGVSSDNSIVTEVNITPKRAILSSPIAIKVEDMGGKYSFSLVGKGRNNGYGLITGSIVLGSDGQGKGDAGRYYLHNVMRATSISTEILNYDSLKHNCRSIEILRRETKYPVGAIDILRAMWLPSQILLAKEFGLKRSEVEFTWLSNIELSKNPGGRILGERLCLEAHITDVELLHYGNSNAPYLEVGYTFKVSSGADSPQMYTCSKLHSIPLKKLPTERLADFSKYDRGRRRFA